MTTTQTIAGHSFTLTKGRRYRASFRTIGQRARTHNVLIYDITEATGIVLETQFRVARKDDGLALVLAFNDGPTFYEGRVW